jgi:hypothetical protein
MARKIATFLGLGPLVLLFLTISVCQGSLEKKIFTLYDSWKGEKDFRKRGQITLTAEDDDVQLSIQNDAVPPSILDGLYQVKIVDDSNPSAYAMTSIPACQLRRANFRDEIALTLGPAGSIISISYDPMVSPLAPSCRQLAENDSWPKKDTFESKISFETSTPAMTLPTVLPHSKPPGGLKFFPRSSNEAKSDPLNPEGQEPPKSFFQRYWYIFAAFFLVQLFQGGGGGGEQQGQTSQQQGGGVAAPAAAPSPGGGARRRGKRD